MKADEQGNLWLRQSWIDTVSRCAEAGRYDIVAPERNAPSDATALGTAAHAAIEARLTGTDPHTAMTEAMTYEMSLPGFGFKKYRDVSELYDRAWRSFLKWEEVLYPLLPPGSAEVGFKVPIYKRDDGIIVGIEGTIDYVSHTTNQLWDWKCPGRKYSQKEKQKWAIQPSIYALAAVSGGLDHLGDREPFTLPLEFRYGILVHQVNDVKVQHFGVTRTQAHIDFAIAKIKALVDLYLKLGTESPWPMTDEGNYLCSDIWCGHWAECKGKFLDWRDDYIEVEE